MLELSPFNLCFSKINLISFKFRFINASNIVLVIKHFLDDIIQSSAFP